MSAVACRRRAGERTKLQRHSEAGAGLAMIWRRTMPGPGARTEWLRTSCASSFLWIDILFLHRSRRHQSTTYCLVDPIAKSCNYL